MGVSTNYAAKRKEIPDWVKVRIPIHLEQYKETLKILREDNLTTVCQEAKCPNIYDCFSRSTATFMVLGENCTRNCLYCNVKHGKPEPVDMDEPKRLAQAVKKLGLNYAVVTCVTRDDLGDSGADIFIRIVKEINEVSPECKVELLISDLRGNWTSLKGIVDVKPDVINHNVEVVSELFSEVRPQGSYGTSLELLKKVKDLDPNMITKSGMMVGLGETKSQVIQTIEDLVKVDCNVMTIGQYLRPTPEHAKVKRFYTPGEFDELKRIGESLGFDHVESGPLVRSSYKANECYQRVRKMGIDE